MNEIFDGVMRGVIGLLVVYVGFVCKEVGRILCQQSAEQRKKLKPVLYALAASAFLGALAAGDFVHREGGDSMFDAGEIVDVRENPTPMKSGLAAFTFSFVLMSIGIARTEVKQSGQ